MSSSVRFALGILMALCVGVSACASGRNANQWPRAMVAQRDFAVDQIIYQSEPRRLWLISAPGPGGRVALEFFTGERIEGVKDEAVHAGVPSSSGDGGAGTYGFTDATGRRFDSKQVVPSDVIDTGYPSAIAGWERNGRGHEVILGERLSREDAVGADFFDGGRVCDEAVFVSRTQGARFYDADENFVPRARIIANYDSERGCWDTRPHRVVDLNDNTLILATAGRVFRISSYDLTPVGSAPDIRVIDVQGE